MLNPSHAGFYGAVGDPSALAAHLVPGGVFALWSNDPPDDGYLAVLATVFDDVEARVISFPNPLQGGESTNTVYLGDQAGPTARLRSRSTPWVTPRAPRATGNMSRPRG